MPLRKKPSRPSLPDKNENLEPHRNRPEGTVLTTEQGVPIPHTDDSLKAGVRGPTIMEDFHFREKITHFDHERIPERVVHARGTGAHGYFQVYKSMAKFTKAAFLQDPDVKTPVFVRFSTVAGSKGSSDLARDVRGFATRFYTSEGNFDLVGNNIPVFFIQDGIKFPDVVHAVKPEPHHEMPQASSAHDNFWDFISLMPESAHMIMWVMSDRAIPRSLRMMEGFGVHTFRLVNAEGKGHLVKFHWKPVLGVHSVMWDEAQKISGKDPDFHRRDLWEAIELGVFPEWELGMQIIPEENELEYGFDLLDATKLLPEEIVPVTKVGKMVLNRNVDNFFAETEQVAFHLGNLPPGIDVTNDPLFQARLFSYLDTQLTRLGGPNFTEIPINRPVCPVHNFNQQGFMRQTIHTGRVNYHPNSLGGNQPALASREQGYTHYEERVGGTKIRARAETFKDHFSQATLFYNSLTQPEQEHLAGALEFELAKVEHAHIRARVVNDILAPIDSALAIRVAKVVGVEPPKPTKPAKAKKSKYALEAAPSLSQMKKPVDTTIATRKIAMLVAPGFSSKELTAVKRELEAGGAKVEVVAPTLGPVESHEGKTEEAKRTYRTAASVLYDAVYVPGGKKAIEALKHLPEAVEFVREAFRHCKPLGFSSEGAELLEMTDVAKLTPLPLNDELGVVLSPNGKMKDFGPRFIAAIAQHRFFSREVPPQGGV